MAGTCRAAALAAVLLVAGCATPGGRSVRPDAKSDAGAKVVTSDDRVGGHTGVLDAATARAETERILEGVAAARNLKVLSDVEVDVIDRPGIREFARKNIYEHTTKEDLELEGRIDSALGVIPVGSDPETVILELLEEGVLGFYDPKRKALFIGDFVPPFLLSQVVGHEIAHALQDMHVGLEKHQLPLEHRSDAEAARTFLIEGEAQAAYYAWVSGADGLASIDDAVLDAMGNQALDYAKAVSPYPVLARSLQLPYADGAATVVRLVLSKGWKAVDALWKDIPRTSEQMLHLDKLIAREPAMPVRFDAAALEQETAMKAITFDELGESALLAMLADVEPSTTARAAASGWGGGHLVALASPGEPDGAPTIVAAVVWDSQEDAAEFEVAFAKYLDTAPPQGTFISRRRDAVVFATNVPERIAIKSLQAAAWKALSRTKGGAS